VSRWVVFDLFHTLIDGADDERDRVVAGMAEIVGVEPSGLVRAYHETWRQRLLGWDVEETVRILAGRLGGLPIPRQVTRAADLRRALARRMLSAVPPTTLDTLDSLRAAGYRLGLISNATAESAETWRDSPLARRFDVAIFSSTVGLAKPDPRIYVTALKALNAPPASCFYVGDGADGELAGAAATGMTVIRTTEFNDTDPSWSGPAIASLTELPGMLARNGQPDGLPA
jgi:putative hydrolase of the HAD superfamily